MQDTTKENESSSQPKTLGRCADCGKGWYTYRESTGDFACDNRRCGANPRGGIANMNNLERGREAKAAREAQQQPPQDEPPRTGTTPMLGSQGTRRAMPTQEEKDAADAAASAPKASADDPPIPNGHDDAAELENRDADVTAAQERTANGKIEGSGKSRQKPPPDTNNASPQGTLANVKPSRAALRIIRAWLAARDIQRKIGAFKKQLMQNLDVQMAADKVDFLKVDGVEFFRKTTSEVDVGAFDDWTPSEDSTEALMKMLGVTKEDLAAATGEKTKK